MRIALILQYSKETHLDAKMRKCLRRIPPTVKMLWRPARLGHYITDEQAGNDNTGTLWDKLQGFLGSTEVPDAISARSDDAVAVLDENR